MKTIKLYPPKGGQPITPHPSKVDEMLSKGWTLEPKKSTPVKTKTKESS